MQMQAFSQLNTSHLWLTSTLPLFFLQLLQLLLWLSIRLLQGLWLIWPHWRDTRARLPCRPLKPSRSCWFCFATLLWVIPSFIRMLTCGTTMVTWYMMFSTLFYSWSPTHSSHLYYTLYLHALGNARFAALETVLPGISKLWLKLRPMYCLREKSWILKTTWQHSWTLCWVAFGTPQLYLMPCLLQLLLFCLTTGSQSIWLYTGTGNRRTMVLVLSNYSQSEFFLGSWLPGVLVCGTSSSNLKETSKLNLRKQVKSILSWTNSRLSRLVSQIPMIPPSLQYWRPSFQVESILLAPCHSQTLKVIMFGKQVSKALEPTQKCKNSWLDWVFNTEEELTLTQSLMTPNSSSG